MLKNTIIHFSNHFEDQVYFHSIILEGDILKTIHHYESNNQEDSTDNIDFRNLDEVQSFLELFFAYHPSIEEISLKHGKQQFGWYPIEGLFNLDIITNVSPTLIPSLINDWESFITSFFPDIIITNTQSTSFNIIQNHFNEQQKRLEV